MDVCDQLYERVSSPISPPPSINLLNGIIKFSHNPGIFQRIKIILFESGKNNIVFFTEISLNPPAKISIGRDARLSFANRICSR
jgi:hypothetical protein